ncbi:MAG: nitroreductase family protein [Candidatus Latescibacteria bacterium]|nr:nitroreductase family protein [Candidatus Latescibacterota bacterium]
MDFFSLIKSRRSIRIYEPWTVEPEKLYQILEAINAAPSAGNLQAYDVVVVRDQDRKQQLAAAAWDQTFIAQAPLVLVFCANPGRSAERYKRRGAELYCIQDAAIAAAYAQLAATALDLASVWVGSFETEKVCEALGATAEFVPVTIMPIGYPAESPPPSTRRPLIDLVHEERLDD